MKYTFSSLIFIITFTITGCNQKNNNMNISEISQNNNKKTEYVILISANAEWRVIKELFPNENYLKSPWGEYFHKVETIDSKQIDLVYFHGGWGKIAAAGSAQYVIDEFNPEYIINIGTCGGFNGKIEKFATVLCTRTIVYDIIEAMGDSKEAIEDYTTKIDLNWLNKNYPVPVIDTLLVSADRDLVVDEIEFLNEEYGAIAGDWETGGIAYVCHRNNTKLLILRSVTDLVNTYEGEAYGNFELFEQNTKTVMTKLVDELPLWIQHIEN